MSASYPTIEEAAVVAAAEKLMIETMARYDPSHDAYHGSCHPALDCQKFTPPCVRPPAVQRVRKTALQLAHAVSSTLPDDQKPDLLTIELAALLHDVLDKKYVSAAEASNPYSFFLPFFQTAKSEHGVDLIADGRAREIAKIVTNVSWSTEKKLIAADMIEPWHRECIELHCVQDADRLDAIGAFGESATV